MEVGVIETGVDVHEVAQVVAGVLEGEKEEGGWDNE